jgi:general secretion pathway protein A
MYFEHFGLRESPFALTPDPNYLFMTDGHKEALASMIYGVQERRGFVLVAGEVGTGKTTLIRHLLGHFGDNVRTCYILNTLVSFDELLEAILRDLALSCPSHRRLDMIETLNEYLIKETEAGRYVVLIIDEAQHLSSTVLEDLRMLSNLETSQSKLLQIILVGQPEIFRKLARPSLRQLRQRIGLVAQLKPLTFKETTEYIEHRLHVAGRRKGNPFTRAALRKIHAASGGIPRLVNLLCDKALVLAYGDDVTRIRRGIISQVVKEREFSGEPLPAAAATAGARSAIERRGRPVPLWRRLPAAILLLVVVVGAAILALWQAPHAVGRLRGAPTAGSTAAPTGPARSAGPAAPAAPSEPTAPAAPTVALPELPATDRRPAGSAERAAPSAGATAPSAERAAPSAGATAPSAERAAPSAGATAPSAGATAPSAERTEPRAESAAPSSERADPRGPLRIEPKVREVAVRRGDTLAAIVQRTYGHATLTLIDHVAMANPTITDINALDPASRLRLPPFNPAATVRKESTRYLVHVLTVPSSAAGSLEKLRPAVARRHRLMYQVQVRLTHNVDAHRVLIGDFDDRAQAEEFARSFRLPEGLSEFLWG